MNLKSMTLAFAAAVTLTNVPVASADNGAALEKLPPAMFVALAKGANLQMIQDLKAFDGFDCDIEKSADGMSLRILSTTENSNPGRYLDVTAAFMKRGAIQGNLAYTSRTDLSKGNIGANFAPDWMYGIRQTELVVLTNRRGEKSLKITHDPSSMTPGDKFSITCNDVTGMILGKQAVCPTCISNKR